MILVIASFRCKVYGSYISETFLDTEIKFHRSRHDFDLQMYGDESADSLPRRQTFE